MSSSRRHQAKSKGPDKKLPNTSRNDSAKSTPSGALTKATASGTGKNFHSTANMITMQTGAGTIRSSGSDRNLPVSSQSSILMGAPKKSAGAGHTKNYRSSVSSRTGKVLTAGKEGRGSQQLGPSPSSSRMEGSHQKTQSLQNKNVNLNLKM